MPPSTDGPEVPRRTGQLNGWKEIAAYLERSVRTVQRWEKDFGLPVRRFGTSRPESVFAFPSEVDAWLETAQGVSARSGGGLAPGGNEQEASVPPPEIPARQRIEPQPARTRPGRFFFALLATAGILFLLWAAWVSWRVAAPALPTSGAQASAGKSGSSAPAAWRVDLDTLIVTDASATVLWRHTFPFELSAEPYTAGSPLRPLSAGIGDVDGDGQREVWFVTHSLLHAGTRDSWFYLFNSDGRVRWKYQFSGTARFGAGTFGPSWLAVMLFVTEDPHGGRGRAIWAVSYDRALFPSVLQRIDPRTGTPLSTYWSNGFVTSLSLGSYDRKRAVFVGACNNEHKGGSLAVLDAANPNGAAPAALEKYRCGTCPALDPLAFLVFQIPSRFGRPDRSAPVFRMTTAEGGGVTVGVEHARSASGRIADALYTLDSSLAPVAVDVGDEYAGVYRAVVQAGQAPVGASETVDPVREFFPILRWDSAARRYVKVFKR